MQRGREEGGDRRGKTDSVLWACLSESVKQVAVKNIVVELTSVVVVETIVVELNSVVTVVGVFAALSCREASVRPDGKERRVSMVPVLLITK